MSWTVVFRITRHSHLYILCFTTKAYTIHDDNHPIFSAEYDGLLCVAFLRCMQLSVCVGFTSISPSQGWGCLFLMLLTRPMHAVAMLSLCVVLCFSIRWSESVFIIAWWTLWSLDDLWVIVITNFCGLDKAFAWIGVLNRIHQGAGLQCWWDAYLATV